jgi:protein-S-isoprenylcysteine O-methyltransferase Ste14
MIPSALVSGLFWRALIAFLALPGLVAYVVPWLLRPMQVNPGAAGLSLVAVGTALLVACVYSFFTVGRGTLAPWAPPTVLVTTGLYRYSRNPMYLAVLVVLAGWTGAYRSVTLALYAAAVGAAFHVRVRRYEEPWLARVHAGKWESYMTRVPRWLGRRGV